MLARREDRSRDRRMIHGARGDDDRIQRVVGIQLVVRACDHVQLACNLARSLRAGRSDCDELRARRRQHVPGVDRAHPSEPGYAYSNDLVPA